jgi:hypothetical protein
MSRGPDLLAIEELGEPDAACLEEVRAVLARHGALGRFGITLLHDHFDVAPNEVLLETCDERTRTLTISPQQLDPSAAGRVIETSWRFSERGSVITGLVCKVGCFVDLQDRHKQTHQSVNG